MASGTAQVRLRDRAVAQALPFVPRPLVRRFSAPYIAGDRLEHALETIAQLQDAGMSTTLDVLGEAVEDRRRAEQTRDEYLQALGQLATLGNPDLVNVSVKLTALGLSVDEQLAAASTRTIVERAGELGGFVRIDMEDSPWTDHTLDLFRTLWNDGLRNVGVVIQAYLKRSRGDVEQLCEMGAPVRVVKGIYLEPESIAYHDMRVINRNYLTLSTMLVDAGCRAAFATHDEELVYETQRLVRDRQLDRGMYEYQMLLGVREELRTDLVERGQPMRVYVPYGAQWYEYSLRRLRENPQVAGYVTQDILRGLLGGKWLEARRRASSRRRGAERRW